MTSHIGFIQNNELDCNTTDNVYTLNQEIVGAIDTNYKSIVYPENTKRNYILKSEEVTYKIWFENIRTYYASRVIVVDTLDTNVRP